MNSHVLLIVCFFLTTYTCIDAKSLIFQDDFNTLDCKKWEHEITMGGGGNWEFEYYTNNRSNSFVRDGVLFIKPTMTAETIGDGNLLSGFDMNIWGSTPADRCTGNAFYGCERTSGDGGNIINPIQSAAIRTANSFSFQYGQLEVRAKLPRGDWIWPAIWLMPRYNQYGQWPASGEIDLVESRGNAPSYGPGGVDTIATTLHYGPYWAADAYTTTHETMKLPGGATFADSFHTFGFKWDSMSFTSYLDNETNIILHVDYTNQSFWQRGGFEKTTYDNPWYGRPNAAPFDQEYYIIFNVAVGGANGYFPDGEGGKPWSDQSSHAANEFYDAKGTWYPTWKGDDVALQIDYIKVWQ